MSWARVLGLLGVAGLIGAALGGSGEEGASGDDGTPQPPEPAPAPTPPACPPLPSRGVLGGLTMRSYTPASGGATPVVLLHGRGASEDAMFAALAGVQIPAAQVYARGPVGLGSGHAWLAERSSDPAWSGAIPGALLRLKPLLEVVTRCWGRPLVAGHSQGAHMALAAAAVYPELVAGAVAASGALPPLLREPFRVPVVAIHGRDDATVRFSNLATLAELGARTVAVDAHGHGFSGRLRAAFSVELVAALG